MSRRNVSRPGAVAPRRGTRKPEAPFSFHRLLQLQQKAGNAAVQRLLSRAPQESDRPRSRFFATIVIGTEELRGGSKIPGYEGTVEFESVNRATRSSRATGRDDKQALKDLHTVKQSDETTPRLASAASRGDHIPSAKFVGASPDAEGNYKTGATVTMTDAAVVSFTHNDSPLGPVDDIVFNGKLS